MFAPVHEYRCRDGEISCWPKQIGSNESGSFRGDEPGFFEWVSRGLEYPSCPAGYLGQCGQNNMRWGSVDNRLVL